MLEELQSLSETNKKRVLVIATIIIMAIIIGVWMTYFNGILAGAAHQSAAQATSSAVLATASPATPTAPATIAPVQESIPGLWQSIKNGFGSIVNVFRKPSQYTIKPQ